MPRSLVIQHFFVISGNSLKPPGHKRNRPKILPEVALHFLEHSVLRTVQIFKNILILTECPLVNVDFLNGGIADGIIYNVASWSQCGRFL